MNQSERLGLLRQVMKEYSVDAYIIEGKDPHQSEQPAQRWESRKWITGFTGSAGIAAVTQRNAALWVDSRYHLQGELELQGTEITLQKSELLSADEIVPWLLDNLGKDAAVGFNQEEISAAQWKQYSSCLQDTTITMKLIPDLLDEIWKDRPALPDAKILELPKNIAGKSREKKIQAVREEMKKAGASWYLLSSLDDIAWILNLRGNDIPYHPLFLAYACIGLEHLILCVDKQKIPETVSKQLNAEILPYENAFQRFNDLIKAGSGTIMFDPEKTPMLFAEAIYTAGAGKERENITTEMKMRKEQAEIESIKHAHLQDGAAVVSFLSWLEKREFSAENWDEYMLAEELLFRRRKQKNFFQESFSPIVAFGPNGAIVHYRAEKTTASKVAGRGLLLIDSGAHYLGGTTDITRTIPIGTPSQEEITDYTLVLKGHLKLAATPFPEGTKGNQLDGLARQFLWEQGREYGHGTGHGVGYMLCVHEGPVRISRRNTTIPLEEGMILSNEPGIYRTGKYGIRIENLMCLRRGTENSFGKFLQWEQLTLCPYERMLIDLSLLTEQEVAVINTYHQRVYEELSPYLTEEEQKWLKEKTKEL